VEEAMKPWTFLQADATALPFEDQTFDLTLTSPPYMDARTYGIGAQRGCVAWVEWMLKVVTECQRVTKGPVIIVAAGVTRDRNYWPGCEGLMWEWWKRGGDCQLYRPVFWHRVGIPGSGGKDWFRADVEYAMCFKRPGKLAWADPTACGHPPKWGPGGEMSHRTSGGKRVNQWGGVGSANGFGDRFKRGEKRVNQWGHSIDSGATVMDGEFVRSKGRRPSHVEADRTHTKRLADGTMETQGYNVPVLANPGNLVKTIVGGGTMGHPLAHENEAPYPEKLCERFIKSLCPPGGFVLDPFSGSGTTVDTAVKLGRRGVGCDIRENQCQLGTRRMLTPFAKKVRKVVEVKGELDLFSAAGEVQP
jgi:hypothetical protein